MRFGGVDVVGLEIFFNGLRFVFEVILELYVMIFVELIFGYSRDLFNVFR